VPVPRSFGAEATSAATPEAVFHLLADAPSWSSWAGPLITRAGWVVAPGRSGVGAVRRLGRPPLMVKEEIVVAAPPFHHGYRLVSGQPVRSYRADVRLTALDAPPGGPAGTHIEWTGTVVPLVPGTGWLVQRLFGRMLRGFAARLATAAEAGLP
jgi:hypothetical protein